MGPARIAQTVLGHRTGVAVERMALVHTAYAPAACGEPVTVACVVAVAPVAFVVAVAPAAWVVELVQTGCVEVACVEAAARVERIVVEKALG